MDPRVSKNFPTLYLLIGLKYGEVFNLFYCMG